MFFKRIKFFILLFVITIFISLAFAQDDIPVITDVKISGNRLVNTNLIMKQLRTQPGTNFSRIDINKDIKRLYQMNYFSSIDVDISQENDEFTIIFIIKEKPEIRSINIFGNSKFKDKHLLKKISSSKGNLLNEKLLASDKSELRSFYEKKGFKQAEIKYELAYDDNNEYVDVNFTVNEGKKIKIEEINIIGASNIPEKKVLKIMKTKRKKLLNSGFFDEEKFEEDLDRIRAFYYQQGYIDIKIKDVSEDYVKENSRVIINVSIYEGELYTIGTLQVEGNEKFAEYDLLSGSKLQTGDTYLPANISAEVKRIRDIYFRKGYIDAKIDLKTFTDENDSQLINLKLIIQENEISFIDQIRIAGNKKTKDKVIRRELNLSPGDQFDGVKMTVAQRRLSNLGLFKSVDIYPDPTTRDPHRDLFIEVEEDRTGELGFGAGYSSVDKLIGFLEVTQSNFDLFNLSGGLTGGAQKLKLRSEFGNTKREFLLDFTEPWMFDKRLLFGFKVYSREREYDDSDYEEAREGFSLRFAKPIFKYTRAELSYLLETVEVKNVDEDASLYLRSQEGERDVGKISLVLSRDVRNSYFNATAGSKLKLELELAGPGGDTDYYRAVTSADLYFNPWFNHVLISSLKVGYMEEYGDSTDVPIFDRFYLGGAWNVRGFDYRGIGPKDSLDEDEPIGGKFMYYGTFEYVIPLAEQLRFAFFTDYGYLFDDIDNVDNTICASVGVGMRIMISQNIPLRFDYAWPIETDDYNEEENGQFTFDIGQRF